MSESHKLLASHKQIRRKFVENYWKRKRKLKWECRYKFFVLETLDEVVWKIPEETKKKLHEVEESEETKRIIE